jgi:hypothetical protein
MRRYDLVTLADLKTLSGFHRIEVLRSEASQASAAHGHIGALLRYAI